MRAESSTLNATTDKVDVDAVASAVLRCHSVMGLGNEIETYLSGLRIAGIQACGEEVPQGGGVMPSQR